MAEDFEYRKFSNNSITDIKFDLARNFIHCQFPSSLKQISGIRVILSLYQEEILCFKDHDYNESTFNIYDTENILYSINTLKIPKNCKEYLEKIVGPIGEEITKLFKLQSIDILKDMNLELSADVDRIKAYATNIYMTSQLTLDQKNTAHAIVGSSNLRTLEKYIIACNNCLIDKINELIEKLPENFLYKIPKNRNFLLTFYWTCRVRNQPEEFRNYRESLECFKDTRSPFIFYQSLEDCNEVAVQYFWENLEDKNSMKEYILAVAENKVNMEICTNIFFYLVSQVLNKNEIIEIFSRSPYKILTRLAEHWRWKIFFISTAKLMLQFEIKMHELADCLERNASNILLDKPVGYLFTLNEYKYLFNDFLTIFVGYINSSFLQVCQSIFNEFIEIKDYNGALMLLSYGTDLERRQLFYDDDYGMELCKDFIYNDDFQHFKIFVSKMLSSEEDIKQFFHINYINICVHFVIKNQYSQMEEMLNSLCEIGNISDIKRALAIGNQAAIVDGILSERNIADKVLAVNEFLGWCAEGDTNLVCGFKEIIIYINRKCMNLLMHYLLENFLKS